MRNVGGWACLAMVLGAVACGSEAAPDAAPGDTKPAAVTFRDRPLEACVRGALDKPEGAVTPADMESLTRLECQDAGIADIAGLEFAVNLTALSLWENRIENVAPIGKLKKLTSLSLGKNQVHDIAPLKPLTALTRLDLAINPIEDLAALYDMTELTWLHLDHTNIGAATLENVTTLPKLAWLTIEHTKIGGKASLGDVPRRADTYADYTSSPRAPARDRAGLRATVRSGGLVDLTMAGQKTRREYAGDLFAVGNEIHWRTGDRDVAIGVRGGALCSGAYASACNLSVGVRYGAGYIGGAKGEPVYSVALTLPWRARNGAGAWTVRSGDAPGDSDKALLPFVLASPNQADAGSCLFMSNSGSMEILMNQKTAEEKRKHGGDTDLSERFLMNASDKVESGAIKYVTTDLLYTYNLLGGSLLARDYPFTAGYMTTDANGNYVPAKQGEAGAEISCQWNWIDEMPADWKTKLVKTPLVERTVIYTDPKRDKDSVWNVGLMSDEIIDRIKHELRTKNAPVIVVYNHYLYWHADIVVGYDDEETSDGCAMIDDSLDYFREKKATTYVTKIEARMKEQGGCSKKGVFYVRDSIYDGGADEETYKYSSDYSDKYSKRIIKRSYNWPKYLGNHSYVIHRQ